MTDQYLESVLSTAQMARNHVPHCCCEEHCHARHYVYGKTPDGWERKLSELARSQGYSMHRDHLPTIISGHGCNGFTTGSFTGMPFQARLEARQLGLTEYSIHYRPEETKADEFSVAVHELAHAILGHPDDDKIGNDLFDHEMPVRLASIAVTRAAGLKTGRMSICQLAQRMRKEQRDITLEHQNAGLIAARVIGGALDRKLVAA